MILGRLSTVEQKTVHLMINRFKKPDMVKCIRRYSGGGDGAKTPENNMDEQTNNLALKNVIEDLSKLPKLESFFGCRQHTDLTGKVAVITGGTKGIGLSVAKDLIQNGASRVIVCGRNSCDGEKAYKILMDKCDSLDSDQKAFYVQTDVTCEEGLKSGYDLSNVTNIKQNNLIGLFDVVKCMGGLDILVNGAGILNESCKWTQMIETNVTGLITATELGIDLMKSSKAPGGVVVNLSAVYAINPLPQLPIFSATMAAVRNATLGFSKMGDNNFRILTACMGPTDTSMLLNLSPDDIESEWATDEQEDLLDVLKTKQNVDCAGRGITLMIQFAENGSTFLVANNSLHRRKNDKDPIYSEEMDKMEEG